MPTPANRAKIQLVRGSYSNISAAISDLVDGELCYAKDQNKLYMVEGSTLTEIETSVEGIEDAVAGILVGGTGLTATHDDPNDTITIDLDDTAVTPGTYGSASAVPVITVDQQGRITSASVIEAAPVVVEIHNQTGSSLNQGTPVYVSGTHSSGKPTVAPASNSGPSTYPAIGLIYDDTIADGNDGFVIVSGVLTGVNTSSFSAGDALYVASSQGTLTSTRPTGTSNKVQKVGLVTRSHSTAGGILVMGAGRTNDITNELVALTGVSLNDSDLGTFTGYTITDNSSIKTALQELETSLDAVSSANVTTDNDVGDLVSLTGVAANATDLGTFTGTTITDASSIKDALQELETAVEVEQTSTTGNFTVGGELRGPSTFYIDPSAYGDDTGNVVIRGGLTVNGTTTTIESTTLSVDDKNIELGTVATPSDTTADGGGITLKGTTDKTINWVDSTDAWTFSEHVNIGSAKEYRMDGTVVLGYDGSDKILDNVVIDGGTY